MHLQLRSSGLLPTLPSLLPTYQHLRCLPEPLLCHLLFLTEDSQCITEAQLLHHHKEPWIGYSGMQYSKYIGNLMFAGKLEFGGKLEGFTSLELKYGRWYQDTFVICNCSFVQALKPNVTTSSLKKWDYYTEETLATGPSYDWAMVTARCSSLDEPDQLDVLPSHSKRKIVWPCYDSIHKVQPDAITSLLNVSLTM